MRGPLRQSVKFNLSVEGETEKWYFEHLKGLVNASPDARYKLALRCDIEKSPLAMAKRLAVPKGAHIDVWHVFDFESESEQHRSNFQGALREMRDANKMGKRLRYRCAYSNFTFDLWMVLHRANVVHCGHRDDYLRQINAAYGTSFREMHEYKKEANFKEILSGIGLEDVASAVERAKRMNEATMRGGVRMAEHCGFTYCLDNPCTELHVLVEEMLRRTHALPNAPRRRR